VNKLDTSEDKELILLLLNHILLVRKEAAGGFPFVVVAPPDFEGLSDGEPTFAQVDKLAVQARSRHPTPQAACGSSAT
jgi:hypothetical protein